jgi:hypothetical protein
MAGSAYCLAANTLLSLISSWGGCGSIGFGCGSNIGLSLTLVGYLSNITSVSVDRVGDLLCTAVGEQDVVGTTGGVPVSGLFLAVVVVCVVVLHGPVVGVGRRSGRLLRRVTGGCGTVRAGQGADNGKEAGGC